MTAWNNVSQILSNSLILLSYGLTFQNLSKSAYWQNGYQLCLNLLKHSIIFCYCTTTGTTLWKVEKLGYGSLWMIMEVEIYFYLQCYDKGVFVQRVVSPSKTFQKFHTHSHSSLLSDSFLTFQNPSLERSDNSMANALYIRGLMLNVSWILLLFFY